MREPIEAREAAAHGDRDAPEQGDRCSRTGLYSGGGDDDRGGAQEGAERVQRRSELIEEGTRGCLVLGSELDHCSCRDNERERDDPAARPTHHDTNADAERDDANHQRGRWRVGSDVSQRPHDFSGASVDRDWNAPFLGGSTGRVMRAVIRPSVEMAMRDAMPIWGRVRVKTSRHVWLWPRRSVDVALWRSTIHPGSLAIDAQIGFAVVAEDHDDVLLVAELDLLSLISCSDRYSNCARCHSDGHIAPVGRPQRDRCFGTRGMGSEAEYRRRADREHAAASSPSHGPFSHPKR